MANKGYGICFEDKRYQWKWEFCVWLSATITAIEKHIAMLSTGVYDGWMFCLWRLNEKGEKRKKEKTVWIIMEMKLDFKKSGLMS